MVDKPIENDESEEIFVNDFGTSEIAVVDRGNSEKNSTESSSSLPLNDLFRKGQEISEITWQEMVLRQAKIEEKAKPGQRRTAACEVKCTA